MQIADKPIAKTSFTQLISDRNIGAKRRSSQENTDVRKACDKSFHLRLFYMYFKGFLKLNSLFTFKKFSSIIPRI